LPPPRSFPHSCVSTVRCPLYPKKVLFFPSRFSWVWNLPFWSFVQEFARFFSYVVFTIKKEGWWFLIGCKGGTMFFFFFWAPPPRFSASFSLRAPVSQDPRFSVFFARRTVFPGLTAFLSPAPWAWRYPPIPSYSPPYPSLPPPHFDPWAPPFGRRREVYFSFPGFTTLLANAIFLEENKNLAFFPPGGARVSDKKTPKFFTCL